jgi:hypothetical protein
MGKNRGHARVQIGLDDRAMTDRDTGHIGDGVACPRRQLTATEAKVSGAQDCRVIHDYRTISQIYGATYLRLLMKGRC